MSTSSFQNSRSRRSGEVEGRVEEGVEEGVEGRKKVKVVFVMEQSEMRDLCSEVGGRKEGRRKLVGEGKEVVDEGMEVVGEGKEVVNEGKECVKGKEVVVEGEECVQGQKLVGEGQELVGEGQELRGEIEKVVQRKECWVRVERMKVVEEGDEWTEVKGRRERRRVSESEFSLMDTEYPSVGHEKEKEKGLREQKERVLKLEEERKEKELQLEEERKDIERKMEEEREGGKR